VQKTISRRNGRIIIIFQPFFNQLTHQTSINFAKPTPTWNEPNIEENPAEAELPIPAEENSTLPPTNGLRN
jgi:hypothetical protein